MGVTPDVQRYGFIASLTRTKGQASLGTGEGQVSELAWGRDVEALGWSSDGDLRKAPLVFVGAGVQAMGYDDLAGLTIPGSVVILTRRVPDLPAFAGLERRELGLLARLQRLARLKAAAIIVVEDGDRPAPLQREEGPVQLGLPVLSMPARALAPFCGDLLADLDLIRAEGKPRSRTFAAPDQRHLSLQLALDRRESLLPNVVARVKGRDPKLRNEVIVVGAHFDHLGMGERHSLLGEAGRGKVHPGADDNASGTAAVLELARLLRKHPPRRSVVFLHVSGEEDGLLGSAHWIQHPTVPLPSVKFMVNLDMVGRLDPAKPLLHVGGLGAPKTAMARLRALAPASLPLGEDLGMAVGGSDHMSFAAARIPTFFFFTGLHTDYHKPSDTPDRLNLPGLAQVTALAHKAVADLGDADTLPAFDPDTARLPSSGARTGRSRVAFGILPDFGEHPEGFRISGTSPGSTAAGLGLQAGDVLTRFGSRPLRNLYDFTEALAAAQPGDRVTVTWRRNGREMSTEAVLRAR